MSQKRTRADLGVRWTQRPCCYDQRWQPILTANGVVSGCPKAFLKVVDHGHLICKPPIKGGITNVMP